MYKTIVLSDGLPCRVRQLGLFELDGKGREILGPYRYSLLLATGQIVEDEYDIRALTYTPTPPPIPANEVIQNSPEWFQLREYETYRAALAHEKLRIESYEGYAGDIVQYILTNCVSEEDRQRIIEPDDWKKVYRAALVPQLTEEGFRRCLAETFQGYLWQEGDIRGATANSQGQGQGSGFAAVGA